MEAAQAVGSLVQGIGAYQAGRYNKRAKYLQASEEEAAGEAQAGLVRQQARAAMGDQINAQFSNGFMGGSGTALDALAESQINAALDVMMLRRDAASKARALRAEGQQAKTQGTFALISGALGARASAHQQRENWAAARRGTQSASRPGNAPGSGY
jgi:hypothetical protein